MYEYSIICPVYCIAYISISTYSLIFRQNVKEVGSTDYEYDSMVATELVTIDVNSLAVGTELGGGQFGLILNGEYSTPEKKYFVALKQFRESNENSVRNANVRSEKLVCPSAPLMYWIRDKKELLGYCFLLLGAPNTPFSFHQIRCETNPEIKSNEYTI